MLMLYICMSVATKVRKWYEMGTKRIYLQLQVPDLELCEGCIRHNYEHVIPRYIHILQVGVGAVSPHRRSKGSNAASGEMHHLNVYKREEKKL